MIVLFFVKEFFPLSGQQISGIDRKKMILLQIWKKNSFSVSISKPRKI